VQTNDNISLPRARRIPQEEECPPPAGSSLLREAKSTQTRRNRVPYRGDVFAAGQYYHIYNHAVGQELLFHTPANYEYLLRLVKRHAPASGATVIAYCLMPNHYHFLLRQEGDAPLSKFINVLFNGYVQAINRQQRRKGPLFASRFRHVWIDCEEYITHLCRYIHLNPVKAKLVARANDWPYSNFCDWVGERSGTLKDEAFIREHFPTAEDYRQFVTDWQDELKAREEIRRYLWD
jgi:putative transposase